jgi:hypothetical protein
MMRHLQYSNTSEPSYHHLPVCSAPAAQASSWALAIPELSTPLILAAPSAWKAFPIASHILSDSAQMFPSCEIPGHTI